MRDHRGIKVPYNFHRQVPVGVFQFGSGKGGVIFNALHALQPVDILFRHGLLAVHAQTADDRPATGRSGANKKLQRVRVHIREGRAVLWIDPEKILPVCPCPTIENRPVMDAAIGPQFQKARAQPAQHGTTALLWLGMQNVGTIRGPG